MTRLNIKRKPAAATPGKTAVRLPTARRDISILAASVAALIAALGDDASLTAAQSAFFMNMALPTFWRQVGVQRISPPYYPTPRAPRWTVGNLRGDRERLRNLPALQKEERRQTRLARQDLSAPGAVET